MKAIKGAKGTKGDKVVDDLLHAVTDVEVEVPDRVAAPTA